MTERNEYDGVKMIVNNINLPDRQELLQGAAFNLGFDTVNTLVIFINNLRRPHVQSTAKRQLEKKLEEKGGDKTWVIYHSDKIKK